MREPGEQKETSPSADSIRPVLPAWITAPSRLLAWVVPGVSVVMALTMVEQAARGYVVPNILIAVCAISLMFFLAVLIHEMGHAAGAWHAGMKVLTIHAGPLEMKPWDRTFRWRFSRPKGSVGGLTIAFPDVRRPIRPAIMWFVLGGPVANLIAAGVASIPAWLLHQPWSGLFAAFALVSVSTGVANLLPHGSKRYVSDGLLLIGWYRRWRDDNPGLVYTKLMGLSVFGTTADELPPELVAKLNEQGPVMQLVVAWIGLKASQNRHQWSGAARVETDVERIVESFPRDHLPAIRELLTLLQIEIAFSKAMESRSTAPIDAFRMGKGVDWLAPHLGARFAALKASLRKDHAETERQISRSLRIASGSPDSALYRSESRIAVAIRALQA